ncbi:hypothetical protein DFH27DRAFT_614923 [Peziza echinospora]|nr:hypothetical protein DFH27DRAFT_614923 [Peziza echinospora]
MQARTEEDKLTPQQNDDGGERYYRRRSVPAGQQCEPALALPRYPPALQLAGPGTAPIFGEGQAAGLSRSQGAGRLPVAGPLAVWIDGCLAQSMQAPPEGGGLSDTATGQACEAWRSMAAARGMGTGLGNGDGSGNGNGSAVTRRTGTGTGTVKGRGTGPWDQLALLIGALFLCWLGWEGLEGGAISEASRFGWPRSCQRGKSDKYELEDIGTTGHSSSW